MIPVSDTVMVALITGFTTLVTALITGGTVVAANVVLYLMAERNRTAAHAQTIAQGMGVRAAIHENTVLTQAVGDKADEAYHEANDVNNKIAHLTAGVQDALRSGTGPLADPARAARLADTEKRAG